MGEGVVLESGTHNDLLVKPNGLYARLVHAQELREAEPTVEADPAISKRASRDSAATDVDANIEKEAAEEVPLGRQTTGRSLASAQLAEKQLEGLEERTKMKDYSLAYLFMRMGKINASSRNQYFLALIAASSA